MYNIVRNYTDLNNLFTNDFIYMNHGYYPAYNLFENDFLHKHHASLYHHLFKGINTKNLKVLDIGCGRGGGVNQYHMYEFSEIHACDIVPANIQFCQNKYKNINFKISDAMNLDYEDNYFDIVTNVESSHCYEDKTKFLTEVRRVLKPNGFFLYCDTDVSIERCMGNLQFFSYIVREDITKNVEIACKEDYERYKSLQDSPMKNFLVGLHGEKMKVYKSRENIFIKYICCNNLDFN
jgi:ubiquinone/menaquinone biosynthesis C-methylase UbiE